MHVITAPNAIVLWQDVIKNAEGINAIQLDSVVENYLVWLLHRHTANPGLINQVAATGFLHAMQLTDQQRNVSLQRVGDQCLLYSGLFPRMTQRYSLNIHYFIDLGRSAYLNISDQTTDLYSALALQFVVLMDVLQAIRQPIDLLPLEAYNQWQELGSERSLRILQSYVQASKKD
jgi:hypothetical protein